MDVFILKKVVSLMAQLVPAIPLLMLFVCLVCYRRGRKIILLGCLVLLVASSPVVSNLVVNTLEKQYPVVREAPADTAMILVLGAGHNPAGVRPPNSILSVVSLSRLMEAVRLWETQPDALFVTTAGDIRQGQSHATSMADMAVALGVPDSQIRKLDTARDTEDELTQGVDLLKQADVSENGRLLIVSSATHLPRASRLLKPLNVEYTLAPSDFIAIPGRWYRLSAAYLYRTDRVVHEYVGMLWLSIRHWFV